MRSLDWDPCWVANDNLKLPNLNSIRVEKEILKRKKRKKEKEVKFIEKRKKKEKDYFWEQSFTGGKERKIKKKKKKQKKQKCYSI